MREKFMQFMAGRNGNDQFNLFLLVLDIILLLLAGIFAESLGRVIYPIVLLVLGYAYFRMLSRNLSRRQEENGRYMRLRYRVLAEYRVRHERFVQRKDYKFFVCPSCKTTLRVPRGHGKIKIVCRKCGNSFTGKS